MFSRPRVQADFSGDHVYCSPSWSVRDGTPYSVARIMEFLPDQGVATRDNRNGPFTRVRLAWYYRPSDVTDRPVADSRLLLAAIYSEVCDISQLRSKCYVLHRDKISDLAGWKKRPDRFYFNRLFDPWIRKEFEVIPAVTVRNRRLAFPSDSSMPDRHPQCPSTSKRSSLLDTNMWWRRRRSYRT